MYAIVTIAADGTVAVAGPYTSQRRAEMYATRMEAAEPDLSADVHLMTPPRQFAAETRGESR